MSMVFKTHPLDLHEIRSRIATQLDVTGLAACARVCRDWNASFTPRLYRSIALSCFGPSVESFRDNGHFVQHLDVHDTADVELFHVQGLNKLTTVRFVDSMDYSQGDGYGHNGKVGWGVGEEISGRFLYNNSHSLKSIHIAKEIDGIKFWNVLGTCKALEEVVALGTPYWLYEATFTSFLKSCSQLSKVTFRLPSLSKVSDFGKFQKNLSSESHAYKSIVTHLTILRDSYDGRIAPWWPVIGQWFPALECLVAETEGDVACLEALCRVMEAGAWKNLHSLILPRRWFIRSRIDGLFVRTIRAMVNIQQLAWYLDIDLAECTELGQHFQTLQELDISAPSISLVTLLETCPLLESFKGTTVLAKDLTPGRLWPCSERLKVLVLPVLLDCLPTGEAGESHSFERDGLYKQLSHLVAIETLNLKRHHALVESRTDLWLDFNLESGLSCLHGLNEMRTLVVPGCQKLKKSDALWMVKHWRRLDVIAGMIFVSTEELMEIREVFKEGRVSVALHSPRDYLQPLQQ